MAVRLIVRLGDPVLRTPADAVEPDDLRGEDLRALISDLVETMRAAEGVGLAAPQVGVPLQLFVYDASGGTGDPAAIRALVNPMVEPEPGELIYDWEGCLSIPDLTGLVPRHPEVRVRGLDRDGASVDYVAADFEARVVQHEFDHLNGVVYLDRMRGLESLSFTAEWRRLLAADSGDEG